VVSDKPRVSARRVHAPPTRVQTRGMFVIELTYKVPLTQIDAMMKEHVAFLDRHYAAGTFLLSGRKLPRDGGIIIAIGSDRARVEAIMAEDPFVSSGGADVRVIEFRASQRAKDLPARLAP
jgi:uncharacterized protein YciI